jgi:hypothetical protein
MTRTPRLTVRELADQAQARGQLCRVYDTALPQMWVDAVHDATGTWPQELGFVWAYPDEGKGHVWGMPFPLTPEARGFLLALPESLR